MEICDRIHNASLTGPEDLYKITEDMSLERLFVELTFCIRRKRK